jgi:acetyl-CoA C-acetyltransferase
VSQTAKQAALIGWSQVSRYDGEPLDAWVEALAATGVAPGAIDSLDVCYCQSWPYDDPAGRLAERIGATPRRRAYAGIGGTTPLQLLGDAARRIERGEADVCAVVGGEALATVRTLRKRGERPSWSHRDPERKPFPFEAPFHPAEVAHQVFQAYTTFALRDVARRAHLGLDVDEHRAALGELFAPMSAIAATNPHAWFPKAWTAGELVEPSADNRMVAFPYTKRLVSVMDVDLAGALVLASPEAADRLSVPADRRVHLRGWAYGTDATYVAEHHELWRSPAMARVFDAALRQAGLTLDEVDHADLYSCFPSSVLFALDALGVGPDGALAPFTVTGGLPYAGGAGSCYLLSSLAAMAAVLVAEPGTNGFVTGVGMHLTKHVAAVLSTTPAGSAPGGSPVAADVIEPTVLRPIADTHDGPATIAAYTVHHGRDGEPTDAVLVCDVGRVVRLDVEAGDRVDDQAGVRCYAMTDDPALLADLEAAEWVGRRVELVAAEGGVNRIRGVLGPDRG